MVSKELDIHLFSTTEQVADVFTKPVTGVRFQELLSNIPIGNGYFSLYRG